MTTRLLLDRNEKMIIADTWQDCAPILEHNKYLRGESQHSDMMRHVASIPNVILTKWFNEAFERGHVSLRMYSREFDELVARKLKDPEWAFLRVDGPKTSIGWR